jgi:SAM-dependent methyltransferase
MYGKPRDSSWRVSPRPWATAPRCGFTSPRFSEADYDRIYKAIRPPKDLDPSFDAAKIGRFTRLAAIVRKFQPLDVPFVDFGCGDGSFLHVFDSPAGRGFEIGAEGKRTVGRCEIVTGNWAEAAGSSAFPPESFDFVVAFDVLGHLPRIVADLSLIRTLLKPGGLFFVSVPNVESAVAKMLGYVSA